jgi:hypothetical protein
MYRSFPLSKEGFLVQTYVDSKLARFGKNRKNGAFVKRSSFLTFSPTDTQYRAAAGI